MHVSVLPVTEDDVAELVVRDADRREFLAASGEDPEQVIERGLRDSLEVMAGRVDGELVCIFGIASRGILATVWVPWLVATDSMYRHRREFVGHCRPVLDAMLDRYPKLENFVDARNTAAIRWLRWLGFTIHDAEAYGVSRLPFHRFTLER